jgi:hypothetical protein
MHMKEGVKLVEDTLIPLRKAVEKAIEMVQAVE